MKNGFVNLVMNSSGIFIESMKNTNNKESKNVSQSSNPLSFNRLVSRYLHGHVQKQLVMVFSVPRRPIRIRLGLGMEVGVVRTDLDFLFKKAKRSKDWVFIDEVAILLQMAKRTDDADTLYQRSARIFKNLNNLWSAGESKLDFLIRG